MGFLQDLANNSVPDAESQDMINRLKSTQTPNSQGVTVQSTPSNILNVASQFTPGAPGMLKQYFDTNGYNPSLNQAPNQEMISRLQASQNPNAVTPPGFLQTGTIPYAGQADDIANGVSAPGIFNNPFTRIAARMGNTFDRAGDAIVGGFRNTFNSTPAHVAPAVDLYGNAINKFTGGLKPMQPQGANGVMGQPAPVASPFAPLAKVAPLSVSGLPQMNYNVAQNTANNVNGLGVFNPERNKFAVGARQQYTDQLQNLLGQYTNSTFNGSESLEQALAKKSARGVLSNQINTISGQLTNNSNLAQQDINNSSGLLSQDLQNRRSAQLQLGSLGLNEQQNQFSNGLNTVKTQNDLNNTASEINYRNLTGQIAGAKGVADIANSNAEAQLRSIQAQGAQLPLDFQKQALNVYQNGNNVNNLDPAMAKQYLTSQTGQLSLKQYMDQGLSKDQAVLKASQDFANVQAQNSLSNIARGAQAVLNPQSLLASQVKQNNEIEYDSATGGFKIKSPTGNITPEQLIQLKKLEAINASKDVAGAKKYLLDSQGKQQ